VKDQETQFYFLKEEKVILKAWGAYSDREIGVVKDHNTEASIKYFVDRFSDLEKKIAALVATIEEAVNKGSFMMKLQHLKGVILSHEGIGDYQKLNDTLIHYEDILNDFIAKNRERNTEIKKALVEEARVSVEKINWKDATAEVHDIKNRWIKTGNATEGEQEKLEQEFWEILGGFFDMKKAFYEDKKRLSEKTKIGYQSLVAEAKTMQDIHGKERFEKVKGLKERWEALGNIPKEEYGPLFDQFNRYLKPSQKSLSAPKFDIKPIIKELDGCINDSSKIDLKRLENLREILKTYQPSDFNAKQERKEAFTKIQLLKERSFLKSLAMRRDKEYRKMDSSSQTALEIKILIELVNRDKEDLKLYLENSGNFSSSSGELNPMVEKKLSQQKMKVFVKEMLLEMLKKA
jgi:hypothetical protein